MKTEPYRKNIIYIIVVLVAMIYIVRLFCMQILDDSYKLQAVSNSQRVVIQYPARGLVYDRKGKLLVENQPAYDLMVTPRQVKEFDTLELISILNISKESLVRNLERCRKYSPYKASIFVSQITADQYAVLQEKLYKYVGFDMQTRTLRKYNVAHSADVFGYIGEISQSQIDKDTTGYYAQGDYVGISGLEKSYEKYLRGIKGEHYMLVDNFNRIKGPYKNGIHDKSAVVGTDLTSTIDIDLQEYAYQLMQNKRGGIIAIEPQTGEILLKVSSPSYDPSLLIGLKRGKNYKMLQDDPNLPLYDRITMASYPPGSTFKTLQALIGLQEGVITPESKFSCSSGAYFGTQHMGCHGHSSPLDLVNGIAISCNPYFVNVWRRILENENYPTARDAYIKWRNYVLQFGLNQRICPDFPGSTTGLIPSPEQIDKVQRTKKWRWNAVYSFSIGQGEILLTPIQIANLACCIANRGYYITPHIIKPGKDIDVNQERHNISIDKSYFDIVATGMEGAVKVGTAKRAAIDNIEVCGKTGTAQNAGKDHSIFMAFAPKNNPKIAISVYIENGGFGATYAVPIASLLMEKFLNDSIPSSKKSMEEFILNAKIDYK